MNDELCRHELYLETCSICKGDALPDVYISGGGIRFHSRPDCETLLEGQEQVRQKGGDVSPIERVGRGSARLLDRDPCRNCKPQ